MTDLSCRCGACRLSLTGPPMVSVACCCTSCRTAAPALGAPEAVSVTDAHGATPFVLYRKDRVRIVAGREHLREMRVTPASGTRRIVAACCRTPMFLEFEKGHWLSLYATLWPEGTAPAPTVRTMTGDLPDRAHLPDDIPNPATHGWRFYATLLRAWAGMGFRAPALGSFPPLEAAPARP